MKAFTRNGLIICALFFGFSAHAKFYSCYFTEPFFTILISTKNNIVSFSKYSPVSSLGQKASQIIESDESTEIILKNGDQISLFKNKPGSDGMSDFNQPYDIQFKNYFGGCESEETLSDRNLIIERLQSLSSPYGAYLVNYWPGEWGSAMGFEVLRNIVLPPKTTWKSIDINGQSEMACTLNKGKQFVPLKGTRFERYVHLGQTLKVEGETSADNETEPFLLHSYLSKGYCLAEWKGKVFEADCTGDNIPTVPKPVEGYGEVPKEGNWVFTKCNEGHWTWIHDSIFESDESSFKAINTEFDLQ